MLKTTLTQWQIFNAVVDHGGYLQATAKLNRSHSSLHHAVQKLQESIGVRLIEVRGKQITLTPIGEVMRRRSRQLLEDADNLEKLAKTVREGWETEVRLAVEGIYPQAALIEVLKKFHERGHGTRLKLENVILNGAVEAIHNASADLVISPIVPTGYFGTLLVSVALRPFAGRNHPLVMTKTPVESRELHRHLQIVISDRAKSVWPATIGWLKSEERWSVGDFYQARDILLSGVGFCWLPPHMFEDEIRRGDLRLLNTRDRLELLVPLSLVVPVPERLGPAGRLLADLFRASAIAETP